MLHHVEGGICVDWMDEMGDIVHLSVLSNGADCCRIEIACHDSAHLWHLQCVTNRSQS